MSENELSMDIRISPNQFSLLPSVYCSKEELVGAAQIWARKLNFYVRKDKSECDRVTLICVRGGRQDGRGKSQRTIKCDCAFKLTGRKQMDSQWKVLLTNPNHNHPPIPVGSIPQSRALTKEQKQQVIRLHDCLVAPRQITSFLEINNIVIQRDIYNVVAAGKRKRLDGRSAIRCLLEELNEENCFVRYQVDENDNLTHLFFALDSQINIFKKYGTVLMADCTYKTNRYKMPLLHFVGFSNVGKSFSVGFCFLKAECKEEGL